MNPSGSHLTLLQQLGLPALSSVRTPKPFPSWPAATEAETCGAGGLWLTRNHLLGHSDQGHRSKAAVKA